jgi:hypothetical protein
MCEDSAILNMLRILRITFTTGENVVFAVGLLTPSAGNASLVGCRCEGRPLRKPTSEALKAIAFYKRVPKSTAFKKSGSRYVPGSLATIAAARSKEIPRVET